MRRWSGRGRRMHFLLMWKWLGFYSCLLAWLAHWPTILLIRAGIFFVPTIQHRLWLTTPPLPPNTARPAECIIYGNLCHYNGEPAKSILWPWFCVLPPIYVELHTGSMGTVLALTFYSDCTSINIRPTSVYHIAGCCVGALLDAVI